MSELDVHAPGNPDLEREVTTLVAEPPDQSGQSAQNPPSVFQARPLPLSGEAPRPARDPRHLTVLLWGARGTGKTMFLYGLATSDGFDADPYDDLAQQYSRLAKRQVLDLTALPPKTPQVTQSLWRWDPNARRDVDGQLNAQEVSEREMTVSVIDIPGELTDIDGLDRNRAGALDRQEEIRRIEDMKSKVAEHAGAADIWIFLLDPTATHGGRGSLLADLLAHLRQRRLMDVARKAAIVLTKIDNDTFLADHCAYVTRDSSSPDNVPYITSGAARRLTAQLRKQNPNGPFGQAAHTLNDELAGFHKAGNLKYFALSAAGFHLEGGRYVPDDSSNVDSSADGDRLRSFPQSHTRHLLDPLHWAISGASENQPVR
jgi:hypothetical protein